MLTLLQGKTSNVRDCAPLVVNQYQVGALIVCYDYHAEFIGPGAIASSPADSSYTQIIALGNPILLPLEESTAIAAAYRKRWHWVMWLERITSIPNPVDRCRQLLEGLEGLFSPQAVSTIPDAVLAMLVGAFPKTMATVRKQYRHWKPIPINAKRARPYQHRPARYYSRATQPSKSILATPYSPPNQTESPSSIRSSVPPLLPNPKRNRRWVSRIDMSNLNSPDTALPYSDAVGVS